jgi:neutral ceramidase
LFSILEWKHFKSIQKSGSGIFSAKSNKFVQNSFFKMRFLKILLKIVLGFLVLVVALLVFTISPVDNRPYQEMPYYKTWKQQMAQWPASPSDTTQSLQVGWGKVNFTPLQPTPTAGYGVRQGKPYTSVHDSVFVRALVLQNGKTKAAIVSADLLIIPPTVVEKLKQKLAKTAIPFENVYLGATHTHNSVGGWGDTFTGKLFAGNFNPDNVERIAEAIVQAIAQAQTKLRPARVGYGQVADTLHVRNRAFEGGTIDPYIRTLQFVQDNGQKALLCSYAAHSTILSSETMVLSRDYPGVLVDSLEQGEANFALFMAGAVGSMGPKEVGNTDLEGVINEADGVENSVQPMLPQVALKNVKNLSIKTIALPLREPNARILLGWRLRPWVFNWAFGKFDAYIKVLRVGNVLMVGLPCDFSGELMADLSTYAQKKGLNLVITSFNGGYAGYITPDKYYNQDNYETLTMNWFGPYNGAYFQEIVRDLIDKF